MDGGGGHVGRGMWKQGSIFQKQDFLEFPWPDFTTLLFLTK